MKPRCLLPSHFQSLWPSWCREWLLAAASPWRGKKTSAVHLSVVLSDQLPECELRLLTELLKFFRHWLRDSPFRLPAPLKNCTGLSHWLKVSLFPEIMENFYQPAVNEWLKNRLWNHLLMSWWTEYWFLRAENITESSLPLNLCLAKWCVIGVAKNMGSLFLLFIYLFEV